MNRTQYQTNKVKVLSELKEGRDNAVPKKRLMEVTGCSERALVALIHRMRREDIKICSSVTPPGGYYLPSDEVELRCFVDSMSNRGKATFAAVSSARKALKEGANEQENKQSTAS